MRKPVPPARVVAHTALRASTRASSFFNVHARASVHACMCMHLVATTTGVAEVCGAVLKEPGGGGYSKWCSEDGIRDILGFFPKAEGKMGLVRANILHIFVWGMILLRR